MLKMLIEHDAEIVALRDLLRRVDRENILDLESVEQARNIALISFRPLLKRLQRIDGEAFLLHVSEILEALERSRGAKLQ